MPILFREWRSAKNKQVHYDVKNANIINYRVFDAIMAQIKASSTTIIQNDQQLKKNIRISSWDV